MNKPMQSPNNDMRITGAVRALTIITLTFFTLSVIAVKVSIGYASTSVCEVGSFCAQLDPKEVAWFVPQMKAAEETVVYSSPGIDRSFYGKLPVGFISRISGISEDGNWYAIPLPQKIARDGKGWVSATIVIVKNVQETPEWLKHCDPQTYCGYILANSSQYLPVIQPIETAAQ